MAPDWERFPPISATGEIWKLLIRRVAPAELGFRKLLLYPPELRGHRSAGIRLGFAAHPQPTPVLADHSPRSVHNEIRERTSKSCAAAKLSLNESPQPLEHVHEVLSQEDSATKSNAMRNLATYPSRK